MTTMHPDVPRVPQIGEEPASLDTSSSRFSPNLVEAMGAFLEALDYASDLGWDAWEFAIELSTLKQLRISKSELRWLIGKGLVDHAVEVTMPSDDKRSFRRPNRPIFCKKTCFVLTSCGVETARAVCVRSAPPIVSAAAKQGIAGLPTGVSAERLTPTWDRDRQELRVSSIVVKRFKVPAANQEIMLAAFEEEHWPPRIDDPLPPRGDQSPKRRLQETIKSLNRHHRQPLIRFSGDGSGQGVRWEFCGDVFHDL